MWVGCGECATRYDTVAFGFCPRCGSTRTVAAGVPGVPGAPAAAAPPGHAASRRLQAGGAVLLLLGLFATGLAGYGLGPGLPELEGLVGDVLDAGGTVPGGELRLLVTVDGAAAPANVTLLSGNVTFLQREVHGWLNTSLGPHGAARLRVAAGGRTVERNLLVLEGTVQEVRLDAARDASSAEWLNLAGLLRTLLGLLLAASALLAAGGLAALLRRARWVAFLAPLPALALALFLATGALSLGSLAVAAVVGAGYAFVLAGRRAFR